MSLLFSDSSSDSILFYSKSKFTMACEALYGLEPHSSDLQFSPPIHSAPDTVAS